MYAIRSYYEKEQIRCGFVESGNLFEDFPEDAFTGVVLGKIIDQHRNGAADAGQRVLSYNFV